MYIYIFISLIPPELREFLILKVSYNSSLSTDILISRFSSDGEKDPVIKEMYII
jgi:hypothetical protein